jgi:hypothetical protein
MPIFSALFSASATNSYEEIQETQVLIRRRFSPRPQTGKYAEIRKFHWGVHWIRGGKSGPSLQKSYTMEFNTGLIYTFWSDDIHLLLQRKTGRSDRIQYTHEIPVYVRGGLRLPPAEDWPLRDL